MLVTRILITVRKRPAISQQWFNAAVFLVIGAGMLVFYFVGPEHPEIAFFAEFPAGIILIPFTIGACLILRPVDNFRSLTLQLSVVMGIMLTALQCALHNPLHQGYDVSTSARLVAQAQKKGCPVAVFPRRFQQQFHFFRTSGGAP